MRRLRVKLAMLLLVFGMGPLGIAQDADDDDENEPAEAKVEEKVEVKGNDYSSILSAWEKNAGKLGHAIPRRWLFLQEQGGVYGAPSPLGVDRNQFESYGWLELADPEAIRFWIQLNPTQKKAEVKADELAPRLKRYASLSRADGVVVKTSGTPSVWAIYTTRKGFATPQVTFEKGPESLRQDLPARWLVQQLGYDAVVVGATEDCLVLAKLKPLKRGAQGLILKKSASSIVADGEKDIGALLRIVHENDEYVLAKVSLSKSGRPKVPMGSKVLFDQP